MLSALIVTATVAPNLFPVPLFQVAVFLSMQPSSMFLLGVTPLSDGKHLYLARARGGCSNVAFQLRLSQSSTVSNLPDCLFIKPTSSVCAVMCCHCCSGSRPLTGRAPMCESCYFRCVRACGRKCVRLGIALVARGSIFMQFVFKVHSDSHRFSSTEVCSWF